MKEMLEVFFKLIPKIIFEPIAVLGLIGLFTAIYLYRKKQSVLYWTILISLTFMVLWRVAIQIVSERYAQILIYPTVIGSAFFIFQMENIRKIIPQVPEKICKYIPAFLLIVFTLICIGKDVNYNPRRPILDTANMINADITPGERMIYVVGETRETQMMYYTGLKAKFCPDHKNDAPIENCQKIIEIAKTEPYQVYYILVTASSKLPPISAESVGVDDDSWSLMTEKYFNRKKQYILRTYRYIKPSASGVKKAEKLQID